MWSSLKKSAAFSIAFMVCTAAAAQAATVEPAAGHDPAGEKPTLTFTRHETQYRLTGIWESGTDGQAIVDR